MNNNSLLIIPLLIIGQKLTDANLLLMGRLSALLQSLGVHANVANIARTKIFNGQPYNASIVNLTIEGITHCFVNLLPLLLPLQQY